MDWVVTAVGAVLVAAILRDVFHTLWHPTRHGGLSRLVMTAFWRFNRTLHLRRRTAAGLAGPLGMVSVVALWAAVIGVGWALIYWPHMPDAFSYSSDLAPAEHAGPLDALYVSLVTVATLGLGDIAPIDGWLRVLAPVEALVGFALLTATVSWVLGIYPALARRRALAMRLSHLARTRPTGEGFDSPSGAALLDGLAAGFCVTCVDFLQYAESYYFSDGAPHTTLARQVPYAARLAAAAERARDPDVRMAGRALRAALDDLAAVLDEQFLRTGGPPDRVFAAFAEDHGRRGGRRSAPETF
ncbi:potassium channel family protein [Streptomyces sp. NPDC086023]|uniref:potassium channel family protein n=1 Tax=Streptomyces sp. NPDC086023 TaxID=3365746 RepID=UPI0037CD3F59